MSSKDINAMANTIQNSSDLPQAANRIAQQYSNQDAPEIVHEVLTGIVEMKAEANGRQLTEQELQNLLDRHIPAVNGLHDAVRQLHQTAQQSRSQIFPKNAQIQSDTRVFDPDAQQESSEDEVTGIELNEEEETGITKASETDDALSLPGDDGQDESTTAGPQDPDEILAANDLDAALAYFGLPQDPSADELYEAVMDKKSKVMRAYDSDASFELSAHSRVLYNSLDPEIKDELGKKISSITKTANQYRPDNTREL